MTDATDNVRLGDNASDVTGVAADDDEVALRIAE
jgi:hypothetical protein